MRFKEWWETEGKNTTAFTRKGLARLAWDRAKRNPIRAHCKTCSKERKPIDWIYCPECGARLK